MKIKILKASLDWLGNNCEFFNDLAEQRKCISKATPKSLAKVSSSGRFSNEEIVDFGAYFGDHPFFAGFWDDDGVATSSEAAAWEKAVVLWNVYHSPEEPRTRDYPGAPSEIEIEFAIYLDLPIGEVDVSSNIPDDLEQQVYELIYEKEKSKGESAKEDSAEDAADRLERSGFPY